MKKANLTRENVLRFHFQHPRFSLTEPNGKENILSLVSYIS